MNCFKDVDVIVVCALASFVLKKTKRSKYSYIAHMYNFSITTAWWLHCFFCTCRFAFAFSSSDYVLLAQRCTSEEYTISILAAFDATQNKKELSELNAIIFTMEAANKYVSVHTHPLTWVLVFLVSLTFFCMFLFCSRS